MNAPALLDFLNTFVRPVLDVGILAFLIYKTYQLLVMTEAVYLIRGLLILVAIYGAAFFLNLSTVTWIMNILVPGLVVGLAIILQPELRRIFIQLGRQSILRQKSTARTSWIDAAISAATYLAGKRRAPSSSSPARWDSLHISKKAFHSMRLSRAASSFRSSSTTTPCTMAPSSFPREDWPLPDVFAALRSAGYPKNIRLSPSRSAWHCRGVRCGCPHRIRRDGGTLPRL